LKFDYFTSRYDENGGFFSFQNMDEFKIALHVAISSAVQWR
jgi:hypothetical protein